MANDPMKTLLSEHDVISRAGDVIAAIDPLRARDPEAYAQALRDLIAFFVSYSDGFHHRKEESVLFPELRNHPDFYANDILDELEEHHQNFREHIAKMEQSLGDRDYAAAHTRLKRYFDELQDHIAVENDELFAMADSLFSDTERERVSFRFQDVDRELGLDRKAELERRLAALA